MAKKTENKEQFEAADLTPEEQTEKRIGQIEMMLAELAPGYRLSVYRTRPSWARSWLETIELSEDEPIDLNYLVDQWGGEVLKLRILDERGKFVRGCDVPLMSYPPKVHGQILRKPNSAELQPPPQTNAIVRQEPPQQRQDSLSTVIDLLQRTRKDDLSVLKSLLPYAGEKQAPLSELIEMAQQLGKLKELFGGVETPPAAAVIPAQDSDSIFLQSIAEMVKTVFAKQAPPPPRIVAARQAPNPQATAQAIAARLATMTPDEAQKTFFAALAGMGPDRAQATVEKILAGFQAQSTIEGNEEDEDEDEDDIEDEDSNQSGEVGK